MDPGQRNCPWRFTMKRMLLAALMAALALGVQAQDKTTLTVLDQVNANGPGYAADRAIWDGFLAQNPDVTFEKEELFNEAFHDKVRAYIAAGRIPDFQVLWPSGRSSDLHTKGLLKDLTPLLGADYLKNFSAAAVDPNNQTAHKLYELPQMVTYTSVAYVNRALLERYGLKVPQTYADLKALVPRLKAKGIQTLLMANKDRWPMQSCLFSTVVGRLLGDAWVDSTLAGQTKFTDPGFVGALTVIQNLYKDGILSADTIQMGYGEAPALFAAGKAAILVDGDWRQGDFLTNKNTGVGLISPAQQASDFVLTVFPALPGEKNPGSVSAIVGVGYGISAALPAGSAREKAAVRLLKYLYSPEVQKQRLESGAYIPSRKGVTSDKLEPFTVKIMELYGRIPKTTYVMDGVLPPSVNDPLNAGLEALGLGTKTPAQVAAEMQAKLDEFRAKK